MSPKWIIDYDGIYCCYINFPIMFQMAKCEYCEGMYRSGIMLQRHISRCHPNEKQKYSCNTCTSKYCSMDELLYHYLKHWVEGGTCPLCNDDSSTTFTRRARILAHILEKHNLDHEEEPLSQKVSESKNRSNAIKRYLCQYCNKSFNKPSQVKRHVLIHTGERPFECEYCGSSFNQKNALSLHILTHTNTRPHKCKICPDAFNQRVNLRAHMKTVHPLKANPQRHFCPHCPSSFRNSTGLNMHHNRLHQNLTEDKIINNTVNDVMKGLASLNSQTQDDSDILQKALYCSGINSQSDKFENDEKVASDNISKPTKSNKTTNIKPYKCNECNKKFRQPHGLSLHQYNIHVIRKKKRLQNKNNNVVEKQNDMPSNIDDFFSKNDSKIDIDLSLLPLEYPSSILSDSNIINISREEPFQFMENVQMENQKDINSITEDMLNPVNQLTATLDLDNESLSIEKILSDQDDLLLKQYNSIPISPTNENAIFDNNLVYLPIILNEEQNHNLINDNNISLPNNSLGIELASNFCFDKSSDEIITLEKGHDPMEHDNDIPVISIPESSAQNNELIFSNPTEETFIVNYAEGEITFMNVQDKLQEIELQNLRTSLKQRSYKNPPLKNCCDQCPASFYRMSDLTRHKRIHTREKPFVCEVCKRAFSIKSTYKRHLSIHCTVKKKNKVRCQVCGDLFANKTTHKLHMRVHTGVKPFKCPLCNEAFRTSGHRSVHLKVHFKTNGRKSKKYISELFSLKENDIK